MKKNLILLLSLILFTGCSINYNLYIKSDGIVEEKIKASKEEKIKKSEYNKINRNFENDYGSILKKYDYNYKLIYNNENTYLDINKKDIINNFFDNSLFKEYFEDYELYDSGNIRIFKTIGSNYLNDLFITKNYESSLIKSDIDKLTINITFDNKVISSNADKYDELTNTYTWIFDKNNLSKDIQFSYDNNNIVVDNNEIISGIKPEKKVLTKKLIVLTISVLVIFLTGLLILIFINKKRNKL